MYRARYGDDSSGEDVGGGDPDDVTFGRRTGRSRLDVIVRPAGQGTRWTGEIWCVGLFGDDVRELGAGERCTFRLAARETVGQGSDTAGGT